MRAVWEEVGDFPHRLVAASRRPIEKEICRASRSCLKNEFIVDHHRAVVGDWKETRRLFGKKVSCNAATHAEGVDCMTLCYSSVANKQEPGHSLRERERERERERG